MHCIAGIDTFSRVLYQSNIVFKDIAQNCLCVGIGTLTVDRGNLWTARIAWGSICQISMTACVAGAWLCHYALYAVSYLWVTVVKRACPHYAAYVH